MTFLPKKTTLKRPRLIKVKIWAVDWKTAIVFIPQKNWLLTFNKFSLRKFVLVAVFSTNFKNLIDQRNNSVSFSDGKEDLLCWLKPFSGSSCFPYYLYISAFLMSWKYMPEFYWNNLCDKFLPAYVWPVPVRNFILT